MSRAWRARLSTSGACAITRESLAEVLARNLGRPALATPTDEELEPAATPASFAPSVLAALPTAAAGCEHT